MKIAYITALFPFGQGERFLDDEAAVLANLSGDLLIVPTRPPAGESRLPDLPARVVRLEPYAARTLALAALETAAHPAGVLRVLATLLGTRYRLSSKVKNLALFPKALAVTRALRAERVDHIHAHWLSTPSTVAYVAATLMGVRWSCTAHRFDIFEDNLLQTKLASASFVRAISARNRDFILERGKAQSRSRCRVVHLGVSLPELIRSVAQPDVLRIICSATLTPVKGHGDLIKALAMLRDRGLAFRCDLAGEGYLRSWIEEQIAAAGLGEQVRLRGNVPHGSLMEELAAGCYDLAVLASTETGTEFEGIPVALIEAMAAGIPCVATRTGSIPELIADDSGSTLVPQRDPGALAAAIAAFSDPAYRRACGQRARACVARAFDVRVTTDQLFRMMCAS